jgi:hypothetical protein
MAGSGSAGVVAGATGGGGAGSLAQREYSRPPAAAGIVQTFRGFLVLCLFQLLQFGMDTSQFFLQG